MTNKKIILNYIQTNYTICKPFLKPGETLIKGYGDNCCHFNNAPYPYILFQYLKELPPRNSLSSDVGGN